MIMYCVLFKVLHEDRAPACLQCVTSDSMQCEATGVYTFCPADTEVRRTPVKHVLHADFVE